jgi:hypothetical protein
VSLTLRKPSKLLAPGTRPERVEGLLVDVTVSDRQIPLAGQCTESLSMHQSRAFRLVLSLSFITPDRLSGDIAKLLRNKILMS